MVQFGRDLNEISDSSNRNYYVDYNKLKTAIELLFRELVDSEQADLVRDQFNELLDYELEKCNRFVEVEIQTWMQQLRSLSLANLDYVQQCDIEEKAIEMETKLAGLREQLLDLEKYRRVNYTAFQKITKKFDKARKNWVGPEVQLQQFGPQFMASVERATFLKWNTDWLVGCYAIRWKELRSLYSRRSDLFPTKSMEMNRANEMTSCSEALVEEGGVSKRDVPRVLGLDGLISSAYSMPREKTDELDDGEGGRQRYFVDNVRRLALLLALVQRCHFVVDESSQAAYEELWKLLDEPTKSVPQRRCDLWFTYHYEAISQTTGAILQWNSYDLNDVSHIVVDLRKATHTDRLTGVGGGNSSSGVNISANSSVPGVQALVAPRAVAASILNKTTPVSPKLTGSSTSSNNKQLNMNRTKSPFDKRVHVKTPSEADGKISKATAESMAGSTFDEYISPGARILLEESGASGSALPPNNRRSTKDANPKDSNAKRSPKEGRLSPKANEGSARDYAGGDSNAKDDSAEVEMDTGTMGVDSNETFERGWAQQIMAHQTDEEDAEETQEIRKGGDDTRYQMGDPFSSTDRSGTSGTEDYSAEDGGVIMMSPSGANKFPMGEKTRVSFQYFLTSNWSKEKWHFCRSQRLRLRGEEGELVILDERMSLTDMTSPGLTFTSLMNGAFSRKQQPTLSDVFRYEVRRSVVDLRENEDWVNELASTYGLTSVRFANLIELASERDVLRNEADETEPVEGKKDKKGKFSKDSGTESTSVGGRKLKIGGKNDPPTKSINPDFKTWNNDILAMKRAGSGGMGPSFGHMKYRHEELEYIAELSRNKPRENNLLDPFVAFHDNVELNDDSAAIEEPMLSRKLSIDSTRRDSSTSLFGGGADPRDSLRPRSRIVKNVQPKTYLANERTFIQWLEVSVLIFLFGCAGILMGTTTAMGKAREQLTKPPVPSPAMVEFAAKLSPTSDVTSQIEMLRPILPSGRELSTVDMLIQPDSAVVANLAAANNTTAIVDLTTTAVVDSATAIDPPNVNAPLPVQDGSSLPQQIAHGESWLKQVWKRIRKALKKLRPEAEGTTAVALGFLMTIMGLFGLWNGYYIFYERTKCIDRAKLEVKYFHTIFGPTFFAVGLLLLLAVNIIL